MLKWTSDKKTMEVEELVACRATKMANELKGNYPKLDALMDIDACHSNGCPLKLQELLVADNANFAHDIFGIRRHLDRTTGELGDCFLPRYSK